ncbi:MAG: Archaeal fructose-1,6-bisphosphatase and related enzyme of inositol monophosphatase family [Candidatus Amesbacteria bacterium GW2011_GWB1_47_19]|nr:MAG: Archaeal fructose-1,6-bisphosphatase and related enzyme of inositol monophosphatase family [Candidatus Amesbacteria bacterium GW2011_GWA1_44_24]KKU31713.1 MAG: Archaeal fructose-1,6-bisphosphatase and related enzyme of inositol monophosphatase family [Candidatus Amesbacteria bacterium GW2011_GWC1_46_24]KKU67626.1 MAG: Archaeal fructose-1,6-bisphosphatase and related enzyme of inositol monophosphatase family [Candidatus Amesbacteria bacterium GW2011_GWB1_47_19]OGD06476.1 MAG: hypothetical
MRNLREEEARPTELLTNLGFSKDAIVCAEAAILGGRKLVRFHRSGDLVAILKTHDNTWQTKADRISEAVIANIITNKYPHDLITGEESGTSGKSESRRRWIFDPLDGTGIYKGGLAGSTTTVIVEENGCPLAGAICDPFSRELLVCQTGLVYQVGLDEKLIPTGEHIEKVHMPQPDKKRATVFMDTTLRTTTAGPYSAMIARLPDILDADISLLSAGSNVNNQRQAITRGHAWITHAIGGEWDVRCGAFATEQAGGVATDLEDNPVTAETKSVAIGACNPDIHGKLLTLAQECYRGYVDFRVGVR